MARRRSRRQASGPQARTSTVGDALRRRRRTLVLAGVLSSAVNLLALTGSLYALHVYNAVLPSGGSALLLALTLAMLALYAASGVLDFARMRLMARAAIALDRELACAVLAAQHRLALSPARPGDGLEPMRDLDQIRAFLTGPGPCAAFDLPFMPIYLGAIFLLHPLLGALGVAAALLLIGLMLGAQRASGTKAALAAKSAARRVQFAETAQRNAGAVEAMGLMAHLLRRWSSLNAAHVAAHDDEARAYRASGAVIKAARPALQSGMLGLGAYLALAGEATAGTMIAASIILARGLAPVETAIASWRGLVAARLSHARLTRLLAALPREAGNTVPLPVPRESLSVENLWLAPPGAGAPVLCGIGFTLRAGAGLAVLGPSASGKTTLARALTGVWLPNHGAVRLDRVALAQWPAQARGHHVGYAPQETGLLEGTIGDNIARFDADATEAEIRAAARAAGIAELIEGLADGYRTEIGEGGGVLSAGQRQRVALARALFREPFLVVLDEPDANLDAEGESALIAAIRSVRRRGGIVVVMAHRASALSALDEVLILAHGRAAAFGPKDAVLQALRGRVAALAR